MAVICMVFFGFVYAFAGTGVAQLFFKNQADGSLTANGSTL
jgi:K+-transporting ATPase c subunit